jgi:hypothetical protein
MGFTKTFLKPTGIEPRYPVTCIMTKWGKEKYILEGETLRMFKKLFPIHSNRRIAEWFGLSFSSIQSFKRELGLKKSMKAVKREQARDIKKICEANGYYDSLRGKAPSEACRAAAKKKREEGFHPLLTLKEKNPRKYRKTMEKWSKARKELFAKEQRRMLYGLERKTKLRVLLSPLSPSARSFKCSMIKRFDYFADDAHPNWLCYDSETRRNTHSEATAQRHGLRLVEGEDTPSQHNEFTNQTT